MTTLEDRLGEYLHVRRQLGFKLKLDGYLLADFVAFLETAARGRITNDLAVTWAAGRARARATTWNGSRWSAGSRDIWRRSTRTNEIPPLDLLPLAERDAPYLYSSGRSAR